MQTPAILNTANATQNASAASRQSEGNGSESSFGQVLSQQIADKRPAGNAERTNQPTKTGNQPREKDEAQTAAGNVATAVDGTTAGSQAVPDGSVPVSDVQVQDVAVNPAIAELLALAAAAGTVAAGQAKPVDTPNAAGSATALPAATVAADEVDANGIALRIAAGAAADKLQATDARPDTAAASRTGAGFRAALADADEQARGADAVAAKFQDKANGLQTAIMATQNAAAPAQEKLAGLAAARLQDVPVTAAGPAQLQQSGFDLVQAATGRPADRLTPHVGTPAWDQALGQKVVWMVAGAQQSASLTLNPPDLGPLQVVLNVSNGQADASFYAAQPEVRQALEAALPKLRDMMNEAGVQLGQTTVSAGMPDQHNQPGEGQAQQGSRGFGEDQAADAAAPAVRQTIVSGQGLVDTFA